MDEPDFWDFMMDGGDELLNSEVCQVCGETVYWNQVEEVGG